MYIYMYIMIEKSVYIYRMCIYNVCIYHVYIYIHIVCIYIYMYKRMYMIIHRLNDFKHA